MPMVQANLNSCTDFFFEKPDRFSIDAKFEKLQL